MMRQFDVYQNSNGQMAAKFPYVLLVQHHDLSDMHTMLVAPLRKLTSAMIPKEKLNLLVDIEGGIYMFLPELMAAVDKRSLKKYICNLQELQLEIKQSVDILLGGV
jgi:toxin CcdB